MAEEEGANDPQFLGLAFLAWDTTVYVVKPIGILIWTVAYYIAFSFLFVLRLLWRPLEFLLLPLLYLGDFILRCILAPFKFLAKFETLYIYLGIAALIGVAGGVLISMVSGGLQSLLGLDNDPVKEGRTIEQWRKEKRKSTTRKDEVSTSGSGGEPSQSSQTKRSGKKKGRTGKGGSKPATILEELDSDT